MRLTGLEDGVPHVLGMQGGIAQVDLIAPLTAEPGLGNHHGVARDFAFVQTVGRDLSDTRPEQVDHQRLGLWSLNLDRAGVDLGNLDVEPFPDVDPLQPEHHVGVGQAEPELVLGQTQQHRVVENTAVLVAQDHVAGPHRRHLRGITGDHVVHERLGVGS